MLKPSNIIPIIFVAMLSLNACLPESKSGASTKATTDSISLKIKKDSLANDRLEFEKKIISLANGDSTGRWPIKTQPYPPKGAILPYKRIVAYYGNLYSRRMGILGEYAPDEMWRRLNAEVHLWDSIDPATPVQPALHYIAVVAQGKPMKDGSYCMRMPNSQIDLVLEIAKMGNAIVFLDIQVGKSNVQTEVPRLEKYLKLPQVHLGIDPEFSMKEGSTPGHKIGTMDSSDVNFCTEYLAKLVLENNLSPKILVVHRFTQGMIKHYKHIKLRPEVQIVMNMDGWGEPVLKRDTYRQYIYKQPVQFTGFKLFYKNDLKKAPHRMLTPQDLMKLKPQPIYIQYQ